MAGLMLQERGTTLNRLKPANIVQAAEADLKLKEKKKAKLAEPGALYSFARKHVQRAETPGALIALAYFDPNAAASTDKKSTYVVYHDRALLKDTLRGLLDVEEDA